MTRAVVFANGQISDREHIRPHLQPADLIIAANGGLAHALSLGLTPHVLVGDLDSTPRELVQIVRNRSTEVIEHPTHKDATDLELALDIAQERGAGQILVFGALGGRPDHALANVLLLASERRKGIDIRLLEADTLIQVVSNARMLLSGKPGDIVTLLALTDTVTGITTAGLEYPLADGSLHQGSSRGVSNRMTGSEAEITATEGVLLVVKSEDGRPSGRNQEDTI